MYRLHYSTTLYNFITLTQNKLFKELSAFGNAHTINICDNAICCLKNIVGVLTSGSALYIQGRN